MGNSLMFELMPAAVASAAALLDLRWRRIPNWFTLSAFCLGLLVHAVRGEGSGVLVALAGAGLGLLILLPFYAMRAIGAGDVKLLAALGALVGPQVLVSVALYGAIVGGVISLYALARRGRVGLAFAELVTRPMHLTRSGATAPYALAIASGVYLSALLPSVIG